MHVRDTVLAFVEKLMREESLVTKRIVVRNNSVLSAPENRWLLSNALPLIIPKIAIKLSIDFQVLGAEILMHVIAVREITLMTCIPYNSSSSKGDLTHLTLSLVKFLYQMSKVSQTNLAWDLNIRHNGKPAITITKVSQFDKEHSDDKQQTAT